VKAKNLSKYMQAYGTKIIKCHKPHPGWGGWISDNMAPCCRCCNGRYAKLNPKGKAKHLRVQKDRARKSGQQEIENQIGDL